MLSLIYVLGFVVSAVTLAVWFYKQRRDGGSFYPFLLLMAIAAFVIGVAATVNRIEKWEISSGISAKPGR